MALPALWYCDGEYGCFSASSESPPYFDGPVGSSSEMRLGTDVEMSHIIQINMYKGFVFGLAMRNRLVTHGKT
jgi:hypothetical protein